MSEMLGVKGKVTLVLTVVLGDSQEVIEVREQDIPSALAEEFCKSRGLDAKIVPSMTRFIEQKILESQEPKDPGFEIKLKPALSYVGQSLRKRRIKEAHLMQKSVELAKALAEVSPIKPKIIKVVRAPSLDSTEKPRSMSVTSLNSSFSSYHRHYEEAKAAKGNPQKTDSELNSPSRRPDRSPFQRLPSRNQSTREVELDSELMSDPLELKGGKDYKETPLKLSRPSSSKHAFARKSKETRLSDGFASSCASAPLRAKTPSQAVESSSKRLCQTIFEQLKPTRKGTLTCATITRCNLTDAQVEVLRPIIEKLVTSNQEMSFEVFYRDMASLHTETDFKDLAKLFGSRYSTPGSRLSITKLADRSKAQGKPREMTEFIKRQVLKQNLRQQSLKAVKKRIEDKELAECTFKPKIKEYNPK